MFRNFKKASTLITAIALGSFIWIGCGEGGTEPAVVNNDNDTSQEDVEAVAFNNIEGSGKTDRNETVTKIFYTIPSPIEMASLIQTSGAAFDPNKLNDYDNISKYITQKSQAINLGVYGADLSYATIFEANKESIYYLGSARAISEELGVSNVIDDNLISRVQDNKDNKDSLMHIVSDVYWTLNAKLKEDDMEDISALVIAGGWLEGLHLATSHMTPDNKKLRKRIAEQKYSLADLIKLMESYENQDNLGSVVADFKEIQAIFNEVEINKGKTETSKDESGTMVIGGKSSVAMTDELLEKVVAKITEIRAKYIQ